MIELVKQEKSKGIWIGDMKDGDIGVVVSCLLECYLGRIVQRHYDKLITIGMAHQYWAFISKLPSDFRVRLLEKGDTLIVT